MIPYMQHILRLEENERVKYKHREILIKEVTITKIIQRTTSSEKR